MSNIARGNREYLQWKNSILQKYNSKYVDEFIGDVERRSSRGKKGGQSKKPELNIDTGN